MNNKAMAIAALECFRGDNLQRAQSAFRGLSEQAMDEMYGQSGKTRWEILKGYQEHDAAVTAAIAWVRSQADTGAEHGK